jgi:hypothetical protein
MAGKIPPLLPASDGTSVKNSQLIASLPIIIACMIITITGITTIAVAAISSPNAVLCDSWREISFPVFIITSQTSFSVVPVFYQQTD